MGKQNIIYLETCDIFIKLTYRSSSVKDIDNFKKLIKASFKIKIQEKPELGELYHEISVQKTGRKPVVYILKRRGKVIHVARKDNRIPKIFSALKELCLR